MIYAIIIIYYNMIIYIMFMMLLAPAAGRVPAGRPDGRPANNNQPTTNQQPQTTNQKQEQHGEEWALVASLSALAALFRVGCIVHIVPWLG